MIILGAGAGGMQPSAPTIGTATGGDASASVAFTPSTYIGKGTITYTATSSPGGFTGTSASSPITVSGLSNGTAYTFTVVGTTNYGVSSVASAASNSITPASVSGYYSIATATVTSGGAPSITFSSIPSSYTHLEIRWTARNDRPTERADDIAIWFNGDEVGTNYWNQRFYANGSTLTGDNFQGYGCIVGWCASAGSTANAFGQGIITIPDYKSTTKKKTTTGFSSVESNSDGALTNMGAVWNNTNAINQIKIYGINGSFIQHSVFHLYGIN